MIAESVTVLRGVECGTELELFPVPIEHILTPQRFTHLLPVNIVDLYFAIYILPFVGLRTNAISYSINAQT